MGAVADNLGFSRGAALARQRAAIRVAGAAVGLFATVAAVAGQGVPLPQGPALPPRKAGFMLYLSQPLGGGGGAGVGLHPKLGFRVEQVRMMGNNGAPDAGDPMQHRALVGWQMDGKRDMHFSDMRLVLGNHVTYDMAHGTLAMSSKPASTLTMSGLRAIGPRATPGATEPTAQAIRDFSVRDLRMRDVFTQSHSSEIQQPPSLLHDVAAAAVATFKSHLNNPGQQRPFVSHNPQSLRDGG